MEVIYRAIRSAHGTRPGGAGALLTLLLGASVLAGCAADHNQGVSSLATLRVTSSAFTEDGEIPRQYTCDGADHSPPLAWSGAPAGTAAFAVLVTDPDAHDFVHWVAANVDAGGDGLPENATRGVAAGVEGSNDFGRPGWGGPCPPGGEHRYVFTVYALSEPLTLRPSFHADELRNAMSGKILAEGSLTARYRRAR